MSQPKNAVIEVGHQLARIIPANVEGLLAEGLSYTAHDVVAGGALGYRLRRVRRRLIRPDGKGGLLIPSGLVALVAERLAAAGVEVSVSDRRQFGDRLRPCAAVLRSGGLERDLMQSLAAQPRALVEARGHADRVRRIALICRLFPTARVMVALNASRRALQRLRRELQREAGLAFHGVQRYPWPFEGGRLVCPLHYFDIHNGEDFDLFIFVDATQVLSQPRRKDEPTAKPARRAAEPRVHADRDHAFARLIHQRVYGFLAPDTGLSATTRLLLQARFGPICRALDPRGAVSAVEVLCVLPPFSSPIGETTALGRKRMAFWANTKRNDYL